MSDKTVPTHAEDYKKDDQVDEPDSATNFERDPMVKQAKSKPGEAPNRDKDEFEDQHLKTPKVDVETEESNAPEQ